MILRPTATPFKAFAATLAVKRVLVRVGGGILSLAWIAEDAGNGGADGEEIQRLCGREVVLQIQRALSIGTHGLRPIRVRYILEENVTTHHGRLDRARDGWEVGTLLHGGEEGRFICYVCAVNFDNGAESGEVLDCGFGIRTGTARAGYKCDVSCSYHRS